MSYLTGYVRISYDLFCLTFDLRFVGSLVGLTCYIINHKNLPVVTCYTGPRNRVGSCEYGNEPSVSIIIDGEFID
jgi:hypothetical protein